MNKAQLVAEAARLTGLTKKDTDSTLDALLRVITDSLEKDEKVQLVGFGSFETKMRAPRTARNPKENVAVPVAPTKTVIFKPGKNLKDAVTK